MRTRWSLWIALMLLTALALPATAAWAQGENPPTTVGATPQIIGYAKYPVIIVGANESATFELALQSTTARTVSLEVQGLPEGWEAEFRGGIRTIRAVYLPADEEVSVNLRVTSAKDAKAGDYAFQAVVKDNQGTQVTIPLTLTIKARKAPKLTLQVDLPTLKGSSNTTFRYGLTVKNESATDASINLQADAPLGFIVSFKYLAKEITAIPVEAGSSKRIDVEVRPLGQLPAGEYPITVTATGNNLTASTQVLAVITGQPRLNLSLPDGRLSGRAQAGKETKFEFVLENNGSAAAHNIKLSASAPGEWKVSFDPQQIDQLEAGQKTKVTVSIHPSAQAVAGDYMVTLRINSEGTGTSTTDFRVTVTTSTLWGLVGLAIIAVAVLVVSLAVARFGRR
ncbi:MAG TPA: hypothetical protein G4O04_06265 [Anaerolineae bacterium]|nr:hypothetical protein [Anaerolineae bacterium]HID83696.1 hypothetical protein [Anaerolineales bacterium]HIQ08592.1 hypothetical protein [Anaerolineaceae bacterium]